MNAVVFDLDGTLIDSAPDLHAAALHMLSEIGRDPITLEQTVSFIGNGVPNLIRLCLEAAGAPADAQDAAHAVFSEYYLDHPTDHTTLYQGARETVAALRESGVPVGLCTNKPSAMTARVLADLELDGWFDAVVSGDTLATRKPDPAPLLHALHALGATAGQGLYIGDSVVDAQTAAAAKVKFALFSGGYAKGGEDAFPSILTFADFSELDAHILS
jgi:phosphoglycolate phosphatase